MIDSIRLALREAGARHTRRFLTGFAVEHIRVRPVADAAGPRLHLEYRIAAPGTGPERLGLEAPRSPVEVREVTVHGADGIPAEAPVRRVPPRAFLLPRPPGGSWDGATIHCAVRLPAASAGPAAIALPDHLPAVTTGGGDVPQPRIVWEDEDGVARVLGGIPHPRAAEAGAWLQLVVSADRDLPLVRHADVTIAGRYARELRAGESQRIDRLMGAILAAHARLLGRTPPAPLVLLAASEAAGRVGILFPVERLEILGVRGADPAYGALASRAASVWWGTAVRLVGALAESAEATLCAYAGARLMRHLEVEGESALRDRLHALARSSRLRDAWLGAQGRLRPRWHARTTLRLLDAPDAPARDAGLRAIMHANDGGFLPVERVLPLLSSDGPR